MTTKAEKSKPATTTTLPAPAKEVAKDDTKKIVNATVLSSAKPALKLVDVKLKPVSKVDGPGNAGFGSKGGLAKFPMVPEPVSVPGVFKQSDRYSYRTTSSVKLSETAEENVSIEAFLAMSTGLVVMGKLLAPVETRKATNLTGPRFRSHEDDELGFDFMYPGHRGSEFLCTGPEDTTEFQAYHFVLNNKSHFVCLDPKSKLWIGSEVGYGVDWDLRDEAITRDGNVTIMMRDAVAIDCHFYDANVLVSVTVKESTLQNATVVFSKQTQAEQNRLPWGARRVAFNTKHDGRGEIAGSTLTSTTVENSDLAPGNYYGGVFRDSVIECSGRVNTRQASVNRSTVKAVGLMFLGQVDIYDSRIEVTGPARIHMPSLRNNYLNVESIYARNKFAITEIAVPMSNSHEESYQLVRINEHELSLKINHRSENFVVKLGDDKWRLQHDLREWLKKFDTPPANETKGTPDAPYSPITESVHSYVIDTIVSRVNMINLIDDSIRTARGMERTDVSRYFSHYF